jgi:hypothetical protein
MTKSSSRTTVIMLVGALVLGCSSQRVRIGPTPPASYETLGRSEGGACGVLLLNVIPILVNSRTQRAYERALQRGGTALIDTKLQYQWWIIPYVGTMLCTVVHGTEIR